MSDGSVQLSI